MSDQPLTAAELAAVRADYESPGCDCGGPGVCDLGQGGDERVLRLLAEVVELRDRLSPGPLDTEGAA